MNWKDLIDSPNLSRKAVIVLIAIMAIVYVVPDPSVEGKAADVEVIQWAIVAITLIGLAGIIAQTLLDWKHPKQKATEPTEITEPIKTTNEHE